MHHRAFIRILFASLFILSACVIYLNESGYPSLSQQEREHFRKYSAEKGRQLKTHPDSLIIYEICIDDAKEIRSQHRYTWMSIWVPYCKSEYALNSPGLLAEVEQKFADHDLGVVLISNTYALADIKRSIEKANYKLPLYILSDSCFGSKPGKALKQFAAAMDNKHLLKKREYFGEFFFKDTLLIKAAWRFTAEDIDILIHQGIEQE